MENFTYCYFWMEARNLKRNREKFKYDKLESKPQRLESID